MSIETTVENGAVYSTAKRAETGELLASVTIGMPGMMFERDGVCVLIQGPQGVLDPPPAGFATAVQLRNTGGRVLLAALSEHYKTEIESEVRAEIRAEVEAARDRYASGPDDDSAYRRGLNLALATIDGLLDRKLSTAASPTRH